MRHRALWKAIGQSRHRGDAPTITKRLQRALQRLDELAAEQQDEIAALIEDVLAPYMDQPSYAGVLAGLLPDDAEEQLLRLRRATPPSPQ